MNKVCYGAALCISISVVGIAIAQSSQPSGQSMRNLAGSPLVPASRERAIGLQIWRLDQAASTAQQAGDYADAEADASQSVSLGIASGRGQEILAASLDAQGKTQEALQAYKVLADEGNVEPFNELPYARLLLETGHWKQAVEAYNTQLPYLSNADLVQARGPFSPNVPRPTDLAAAIHIGLGLTTGWRGYHGTYQDSVKQEQQQFQQAAVLEPKSPLANYYVGYGLKRMGRRAEAQAAFQKAVALDNGDIKAAALKELPGAMQPR
jgi:tetratricopeptide (TPR) repeat protein